MGRIKSSQDMGKIKTSAISVAILYALDVYFRNECKALCGELKNTLPNHVSCLHLQYINHSIVN